MLPIGVMALGGASPAVAQGFRVAGRITQGITVDSTVPLAGAWAVLHGVGAAGGAAVDSQRTDAQGRYRFLVADPDTGSIYLLSTMFRGLTYFSEAVQPDRPPDTMETLVVFDTSSVEPDIRVTQRHLVVRVPDADGGRRSLELLSLGNRGARTRVSPDGTRPVWSGALPRGVVQFEVGESDVSVAAIERRGDSVAVTAPIPPGAKQVLYTYVVPASETELVVPIDQPVDRLLVLLEDTTAVMTDGRLIPRGIEVFEDAQFALFEGVDVRPGSRVTFRFSRARRLSAQQLWGVVVGAAASVMAAALLLWWRRRQPAPVTLQPEALARNIAALDKAFGARGDATPADEARYREERARLKLQLEAALAARPPQP